MGYLAIQIFLFLLIAGALGLLIGWYFGRKALTSVHAGKEREWRATIADSERVSEEMAATAGRKDAELRQARADLDELGQDRVAFLHVQKERSELREEIVEQKETMQKLMAEIALREDEMRKLKNRLTASENECQICNEKLERLRANRNELSSDRVVPQKEDRPDERVVVLSAARSAAHPNQPADDLKRISGVGPQIERLLHDLGIHTFAQIAAFTPEKVAWVDERLKFKGRIEREGWVDQARALAAEIPAREGKVQDRC